MNKSTIGALVGGICAILIAGAVYFFMIQKEPAASASSFQAVFLSNGQVYFGSIDKKDTQFVRVRDVYYVQLQQMLQGAALASTVTPSDEVALIKLGSELHGPLPYMDINRDHILFIEDLREDSKIVAAIKAEG